MDATQNELRKVSNIIKKIFNYVYSAGDLNNVSTCRTFLHAFLIYLFSYRNEHPKQQSGNMCYIWTS